MVSMNDNYVKNQQQNMSSLKISSIEDNLKEIQKDDVKKLLQQKEWKEKIH